jgi:hypothetical protein
MSQLPIMIARFASNLLSARDRDWGRAMVAETASLERGPAFRFALGCLSAALLIRLSHLIAKRDHPMTIDPIRQPRRFAILCAAGAILLGFAYMAAAGAPMRYFAVNAGAFVLGLVAVAAMAGARLGPVIIGLFAVATAGILLSVSLVGVSADGVSRWVRVGGVLVQPSLILVPVLVLGFVSLRSFLPALALVVAALALALAPDRAMAGALVAGLAIVAATRRGWLEIATLASALVALAATLMRPDPSPPVAFVDQILFSAFAVHPAAGLAVWGGVFLLILPALVGFRRDPDNRLSYAVLGAIWLAAVAAAALGNYPTPLVGYGGSAILGYLIGVIGLPPRRGLAVVDSPQALRDRYDEERDLLRVALT